MGVYCTTNYEIECNNANTPHIVKERIKEIEMSDTDNEYGTADIEIVDNVLYGKMDSGRVPNLEYKSTRIWEEIKDIPGVKSASFPFMVEEDGMYFNKEEETSNNNPEQLVLFPKELHREGCTCPNCSAIS